MTYEWNPRKQDANLKKHGVHFANAMDIFEDPRAITVADVSSDEEQFITIGMDTLGRLLTVVYTWRDENIRLISARRATRGERAQYREGT
ncbi:MAG: BrnT family toxin [Candidatus Rokubacteria bacterium]|nr:BrnT family toxin [Candidatus Rokubacteria bacterium]